jgi:energy-coupling factor transporter ATP-binding protein EcfA2
MSTSETTAVSQPKNITAVFIGRTGSGKSTLANTVAGEELFEASEASTSVTETVDAQTVPLEWNKTKYNLKLVDTIGIGDTDRNADDVMRRLADVCHECKDGINAMYFVTRGRFTKEEAEAFDIMWQVIFGAEVCKYTTIVRTDFPNFKDAVAVEDDIGKLKSGGRPSQRVFELVTNTPIYVDNPPLVYGEISSKSREESRKRICNHLTIYVNGVFKPPPLEEVQQRISDRLEEGEQLAEKAKKDEDRLRRVEAEAKELQRRNEEIRRRNEEQQQLARQKQAELRDMQRRLEEQRDRERHRRRRDESDCRLL